MCVPSALVQPQPTPALSSSDLLAPSASEPLHHALGGGPAGIGCRGDVEGRPQARLGVPVDLCSMVQEEFSGGSLALVTRPPEGHRDLPTRRGCPASRRRCRAIVGLALQGFNVTFPNRGRYYFIVGPGTLRSSSSIHTSAVESLGARQSPRGDREPPEPTFGALGIAERLNWLVWKNR